MSDFAPPSGPPPPKVPEGWKALWNEQYSEWFYVNTYTKKSQWDKPTAPAEGGPVPPPKIPETKPEPSSTKGQFDSNAPPVNRSAQDDYMNTPMPPGYSSDLRPQDHSGFGGQQSGYSSGPPPNYGGPSPGPGQFGQQNQYGPPGGYGQPGPGGYGQQGPGGYGQQGQFGGPSPSPYGDSTKGDGSQKKSGGLFGKLIGAAIGGKAGKHSQSSGYPQQGYPPQGYGGYPQGGMMGVPQKKKHGISPGMAVAGGALGVGGLLVGGELLHEHEEHEREEAYEDGRDDGYDQGYDQGYDNGDDGGFDDGGGDFDF